MVFKFSKFRLIEKKLKTKLYFYVPIHSWQKEKFSPIHHIPSLSNKHLLALIIVYLMVHQSFSGTTAVHV